MRRSNITSFRAKWDLLDRIEALAQQAIPAFAHLIDAVNVERHLLIRNEYRRPTDSPDATASGCSPGDSTVVTTSHSQSLRELRPHDS